MIFAKRRPYLNE